MTRNMYTIHSVTLGRLLYAVIYFPLVRFFLLIDRVLVTLTVTVFLPTFICNQTPRKAVVPKILDFLKPTFCFSVVVVELMLNVLRCHLTY